MSITLEKQASTLEEISKVLAFEIGKASKPNSSHIKLIHSGKKQFAFLSNGSRFVEISKREKQLLQSVISQKNDTELLFHLNNIGIDTRPVINNKPIENPPLHAISLAIVQKCNMGCTYCYAEQGNFGETNQKMDLQTGLESIDYLLNPRKKGEKVQVTFLGGEPLLNKKEIQILTEYASLKAKSKDIAIQFSLTTNGTLLKEEDITFFEKYKFSITVSIDGIGEEHDKLRPLKNGKGTYNQIIENIKPYLIAQKEMQISARVTVTPKNLNLPKTLDELIGMGFHSVGFSPLLNAINDENEMTKEDLSIMLKEMIACGLQFERAVLRGKRYPFLNMINAYKEIEKQTHRPYPCGAGAGYMGVSANGEMYACHRFVNDENAKLGNISTGINTELQEKWLSDRHVHQQTPCTECWAKYLCGGGCHHEVMEKGRVSCDYIRSWLYFTIQSFERIQRLVPEWNQ
ncbi:radical SAM/SPASM domain-containing protein [Aureivirga marina]|uniref:radical SAM/SPASM domain-containing protein n=1 Tax=Aureivirga marina TaxID=1182451 RepID=UPI0018C94CD1|nr:radical SAM protein [Aureivirga marina]